MKQTVYRVKTIIKKIKPILKKHQVKSAAIFGSYANGEANKKSDVDILVELGIRKSLLDLCGLRLDLQDALKKKVDIVSKRSLYYRLKPYVMAKLIKVI